MTSSSTRRNLTVSTLYLELLDTAYAKESRTFRFYLFMIVPSEPESMSIAPSQSSPRASQACEEGGRTLGRKARTDAPWNFLDWSIK